LTLSLPLIVPALWQSIQLTELQMQMANEQARATKISLRNEVVKAYYQILLAQDSYKTLQEGFEVAKQNWEEAKERFELGLAAEYDCIFAEVQMQNLIPTLLQVENGIGLSKSFLKVLMGVELSIPVRVEGRLTDFEHLSAEVMNPQQTPLSGNSDLAQLDIQHQQLQRQLKLLRSQRLPTLAGFGQFGYTGTGTRYTSLNFGGMPMEIEAREDWYHTGFILGLQLNVPIFNSFTNKMRERQVEVSARTLQIQRSYVEDNLNVQASAALDNMAKAIKQMESAKKGVDLAQKGYAISEERYNHGMATMLELRSSSQALTQSKLSYSQAISDYLAAKADYEKVLGIF
jgi:outer membrane protein TolC